MNLITDPWIRTKLCNLTPAQALNQNSVINWGRGDWDVSTRVFLIGLLQTAVVHDKTLCPDEDIWNRYYATPPDVTKWFLPFIENFGELTFEDHDGFDGNEAPIAALLPESPGENATKNKCSDIPQWKEDTEKSLSLAEARIALYSDAIWGMRWGRGHRQGPRGESRMTTLVEPADGGTLWQQIWLNVLSYKRWKKISGVQPWDSHQVFPWTNIQRKVATPEDTNALAIYWAMPRRIRLVIEESDEVRKFTRINGGTEYEGWHHPLTPYQQTKTGETIALKISVNHIGYDLWAGIAMIAWNNTILPKIVSEYIERRWNGDTLRIRACGWALGSSGETASWTEQVVPIIADADPELVSRLLKTAESRKKKLSSALRKVMKAHEKFYTNQLYSKTENLFYEHVRNHSEDKWDQQLLKLSRSIFDNAVEAYKCDSYEAADARRRL